MAQKWDYERELKKLGSVAAAGGQPAGGKPQVAFANGLNGSVGAGGGLCRMIVSLCICSF